MISIKIASSNSTERRMLEDLKEQLNSKGWSHDLDDIIALMLIHSLLRGKPSVEPERSQGTGGAV